MDRLIKELRNPCLLQPALCSRAAIAIETLSSENARLRAEPLFGHRSGKHNNTHWMAFMKLPPDVGQDARKGEAE